MLLSSLPRPHRAQRGDCPAWPTLSMEFPLLWGVCISCLFFRGLFFFFFLVLGLFNSFVVYFEIRLAYVHTRTAAVPPLEKGDGRI